MTRIALIAGALLALAPAAAHAQQDDAPAQHRNQLTLDVSYAGATFGYARRTAPDQLLGWELGAAGWWIAQEAFAGDHFDDGDLIGLAHIDPFWRREYGDRFELDVGFRLAFALHSVEAGDNGAVSLFAGPYVAPMVGWRSVKLGPRVHAVFAWEGGDARGLGVVVDPVTARVTLRF